MQATGTIKLIKETQTFGGSNFKKRELVLVTDEQYPQHLLIEFVQDKCDLLDKYGEGQKVSINLNLRGREWVNPEGETKYFNSIQGWRIEAIETPEPMASQEPVIAEEQDDLPF